MPRISPWRTARLTSCSAGSPRALRAETARSCSTDGLAEVSRCTTSSSRSSPVIRRASSRAVAPVASWVTTLRPPRSTVIRSPTSRTSLSLWEMKTTVRSAATNDRITAKRSLASAVVSTAVGSSRMSVRAPRASTRRISTRCCSPTESCQTLASGSTRRPNWSIRRCVRATSSAPRDDGRRGVPAQVHVLGHRHRSDEPEVLVHHPDARRDGLGRRVELVDDPIDLDLAGIGPIDAGQDVAQRGLAGAVLTEQRVDLAAAQLEVDVGERHHAVEALRDVAGEDGGRRRLRRHPSTVSVSPRRRSRPRRPSR